MLNQVLKEWSVVCQALALGRQALLLRKGGIAEDSGEFELQHRRFWLFPTYQHQSPRDIKAEALPLLEQAESERPAAGLVRLSHFAEVTGVYILHDIVGALLLDPLHIWSGETVQKRFTYRRLGLCALAVRLFRAPQVFELADTPNYAGCKSWVELERKLPTANATPVLDDAGYGEFTRRLDRLLNPTAFA